MGTGSTQHRADNSRRDGDPPLGRKQAFEGDGCLATGDRVGNRAEIRGKTGATVKDASRRSDQDRPEPGHLTRRRARSNRRPKERSDGERDGTEAPARTAVISEGSPVPDGRRANSAGDLRRRAKRQRREVSTATN
jgi:hypothetical protein